ncbi:hypothetical protein FIBSPDRAFT_965814 [Athelia psychrophila]|uniref:Uncharacterized protein n=1 Tax=Athelia psychrophila TaxID=1759441 RepID=A0A167XGN2_9AGAM|nr:hypothetical protein FIBSPDRAFT_965814 [Fibularhizoctonia sp. CBS 109695]
MKSDIQSRLDLLDNQARPPQRQCLSMVLSFFIWDKKTSGKCFSQALRVYEEATTNHEAVMRAVKEASRMKQDSKEERKAFLANMTEIVLTHRLSESYRAETGTG